MIFFLIVYFSMVWLLGLGALAGAWFATRRLRIAWLRGVVLAMIIGISTATVSDFMPHNGEFQMPAILLVIAGATDDALEWKAIRNILLVSLCVWPLATWFCRYEEKQRKAA